MVDLMSNHEESRVRSRSAMILGSCLQVCIFLFYIDRTIRKFKTT
jgi:hypothetical protein